MQHQVVDIFCTPTGNVVNVLKINVHHLFLYPTIFNWFTGCVADDQAEKQLFGGYLLKSVDDVRWEKNKGRT
jgi:hypothetical protein